MKGRPLNRPRDLPGDGFSTGIDRTCSLSQMPARPFVSVIIPVYNDEHGLAICLDHLARQTYPSRRYEVLVVDNGSDRTPEKIVADHTNARLVHEPRRGSYAARNLGIAAARGDILAFTDADCRPHASWLEKGVKALMEHPSVGLLAGHINVVPADPEHPTWSETYEMYNAFRQKRYVEIADFGATANVFTRRDVMTHVGHFDETLQSSGDLDWGRRVARAGYGIAYAEDAIIEHPARRSIKQLVRKARRVATGRAVIGTRGWKMTEAGAGGRTSKLRRGKSGWAPAARLLTPPVRRYRKRLAQPAHIPLSIHMRLFAVEYLLDLARLSALARFKWIRMTRGRRRRKDGSP